MFLENLGCLGTVRIFCKVRSLGGLASGAHREGMQAAAPGVSLRACRPLHLWDISPSLCTPAPGDG